MIHQKNIGKVLLSAIFLIAGVVSCKKDCGAKSAACQETPPKEDCQAYFTSWFYDDNADNCTQISYSGCSPKGFDTEGACEACRCR